MELFELAFEKSIIYESFFFNIKSVLEHPSVMEFEENEPQLFKQWELIAKNKYGYDPKNGNLDELYQQKAVYYPEFTKIVGVTYATVESSEGKLVRNFKKIIENDEFEIIKSFQNILLQISSDGINSKPQYFPTLVGYNIINHDIPLFIKRLFKYRDNFENSIDLLPFYLKKYLQAKPWDNNIIDINNLWKFNGIGNLSLSVISDFLNLKRNVDIMNLSELSQFYWENINNDVDNTLDTIALQSANQTNLVIQIMNELRSL
jgi:hypothetical protein